MVTFNPQTNTAISNSQINTPRVEITEDNAFRTLSVRSEQTSATAQRVLANRDSESNTSLLGKFFSWLRNGFDKILNCFCCCFRKGQSETQRTETELVQSTRENAPPNEATVAQATQTEIEPPFTASEKAFQEAFSNMFSKFENPIFEGLRDQPISENDVVLRLEKVKQNIALISPEDLNRTTVFRDRMMSHSTTLLLHAVEQIENRDHCKEIVTLLINRGADPRVKGFYYVEKDVIQVANEKGYKELVDLFTITKQRLDQSSPLPS